MKHWIGPFLAVVLLPLCALAQVASAPPSPGWEYRVVKAPLRTHSAPFDTQVVDELNRLGAEGFEVFHIEHTPLPLVQTNQLRDELRLAAAFIYLRRPLFSASAPSSVATADPVPEPQARSRALDILPITVEENNIVEIEVTADTITIDGASVAPDGLREAVDAIGVDREVIITTTSDVAHRRVTLVLDELRRAGVSMVSLTRKP